MGNREEFLNIASDVREGSMTYSEAKTLLNIEGCHYKTEKDLLSSFCDHLNSYKGFEEIRFDFMLIDYLNK